MSQTPTPEARAAAERFLAEDYRSDFVPTTALALAFDAHTTDLQNTIARLTREIGAARAAKAAEIVAWLQETDWGEYDDDLYGALADALIAAVAQSKGL